MEVLPHDRSVDDEAGRQRAGGVRTDSPGSTGPCAIASRSICAPPRRLIAPATPLPIQNASLAALTTASTRCSVMSPSTIVTASGGKERDVIASPVA